jgi:hypothetical protein
VNITDQFRQTDDCPPWVLIMLAVLFVGAAVFAYNMIWRKR